MALAERVGLGEQMAGTARQWQDGILSPAARGAGMTLEALEAAPMRNPLSPKVLFADGKFPTPTGRVNLITAAPEPVSRAEEYPLALLSLSSDRSQSSQWSRSNDGPTGGPTPCTVHPSVARAAGLTEGQVACLESVVGTIQVRVRIDPRQRADVAIVPKGGHLSTGHCANALIRAATTDIGEGGALYDEGVRLRAI